MSEMTDTSLVVGELQAFLDSFGFTLITIAILPPKSDPHAHLPVLPHFSKLNRIRAFTRDEFFSPVIQQELQTAQLHAWNVYFTLNEGDGLPDEQAPVTDLGINLNCGKRKNIRTLRSLCIDNDSGDSRLLIQKLAEIKLIPHFIVETRPGRHHFYFLIEPVQAEGEHILQWEALQKYLAHLVPDLDQSMAQTNQLVRLPGFFNFNAETPSLVKILRCGKHARFPQEFTFQRLGAYTFQDTLIYTNGHAGSAGNANNGTGYTKFIPPEGILKEGTRRQAITRYMEHLMENTLPLDAPDYDYWYIIDAFIKANLSPTDQTQFLSGGSRRANLEEYFHSQRERRVRLRQQNQAEQAAQKFMQVQSVEESILPDSFYLEFPGDLGMWVRAVHEFSPTLSLELCFVVALIVCGSLKAETFRYKGAWPLINGVCIAPTGSGKSTVIGIVEEIFKTAGMWGEYPQLLGFQTSVQSLHQAVYKAGGVATVIVDEASDYLKAITHKNAASSAALVRQYIKNGTTGRGEGSTLTPGESLSLRVPARFRGFISVWLFTQPDMFRGSLSIEDMRDGLLPRFFIFQGKASYTSMFDADAESPAFSASPELRVWIEELALMCPYAGDAQARAHVTDALAAFRIANPRANRDDLARVRLDAVYQYRSEARSLGQKVQVSLTPDAEIALRAYMLECRQEALRIVAENETDARMDILVRVREMMNRLIACASPASGVVNLGIIESLVIFHRFSVARFFMKELKEMSQDRDLELVVAKVAEVTRRKGDAVTAREVSKSFNNNHRPKNLPQLLRQAVAMGELWTEERVANNKRKVAVFGLEQPEDPSNIH